MNLLFFFTICELICSILGNDWSGRMFPDIKSNENSFGYEKIKNTDQHGRVKMGVKNEKCDMAEDPLGLDGDLSPNSYLCLNDRTTFLPNPETHPVLTDDHIPKGYVPWHHCMNESITYNKIIPTFGHHRPLWAKYGEYTFLPKQRWIHNLEHGGIVFLYHPCADPNEINIIRNIIKNCLYQYLITTLKELSPTRPLALVAWGKSLEISKVYPEIVINFIRENAFKAPEKVSLDGQYNLNLIEAASRKLEGIAPNACPNYV